MKIAEIIINTGVKSLDRTFHYTVEDGIEILPGARVIVPFGHGNRGAIGYFLGYIDNSPYSNLKPIKKVLDLVPLVSEDALELAKHISRTTFCTFSDAIKLMLPPAVNFKFEKIVSFLNDTDFELTAAQKKVLETLKAAGGKAEQGKLLTACNIKSASVINSLKLKGCVSVYEKPVGGTKEKVRKKVCLTENYEEILSSYKPGSAMIKAIDMLIEYGSMFLSELVEFSGCSNTSVLTLEKKGIVHIFDETIIRSPITKKYGAGEKVTPSSEQENAINILKNAVNSNKPSEHLLFGVTGSGKTEVFLQVADYVIKNGKNVIILVPEISLTPQMTKRFCERFGDNVAVIHSGLSLGERYDEWQRIKNSQVSVALGARSAIFAPFENVGLIVVDEAHESTYKSENSPRYDARNIAKYRAMQNNCPVVYATATPRIEDYYNAKSGKTNLIKLEKRINDKLPEIKVIDMAQELANGNRSVFSVEAMQELGKNYNNNLKSLVFLNRRGFSTFVSCRSCGYVAKCPNCSVSLTYHFKGEKLKCHMCDYTQDILKVCPECTSKYIKHFGSGTQKAEETIKEQFNYIEIIRMDSDTTSHKFSHERLLDKFGKEKASVLLGTQMITKGHDFGNLTLCIVLAADTLLNTGEYNSSEKAFSQLVQVCGRAGRGNVPGQALIQTYDPKNKIFEFVKSNDYESFYNDEINARKLMEYPPFGEIISVVISGEDEEKTGKYGMEVNNKLQDILMDYPGVCNAFFGLTSCSVFKIKNKFRYKILVKTKKDERIYEIFKKLNDWHLENNKPINMDIDINPNGNV